MVKELDPADLDGPDDEEPRGEAGEYIHYVRARALLAERLGATPHEIAMWTWLGKTLHGKPAGGIDGYRDPAQYGERPPRFHFTEDVDGTFAYLPQLMAAYYRAEDVRGFEPEDRYLTFERVVSRFKKFCNESEARALVHAKLGTHELHCYHPQTGVTAAEAGEESGFPPLDDGLFTLAEVRAVEAECGGLPLNDPTAQKVNGFVALGALLDSSWDLPMAELSRDQREAVRSAFLPSWDTLRADRRHELALKLDYQRNPALKEERARHSDETTVDWAYWQNLATLSASEFAALRNICDPRKLESQREVFPGGERPSMGQRVDDDLRRIAADPAVARKDRLTLRQWMHWAKTAGLDCPTFMRACIASQVTSTAHVEKKGITRKDFINKHSQYIPDGTRYLKLWFDGRTHGKGEKPDAALFRLPGARGRYDEEAMVEALKAKGRYSQFR